MDIREIRELAIVTPAKNESENMPELVRSLANQSLLPGLWIFINDNSIDGTEEKFKLEVQKYPHLQEKCRVLVFKHICQDNAYALGAKYSRVVRFGFDRLAYYENKCHVTYRFIGILDSDVFPEPQYYEKLLKKMDSDPSIGIASAGKQLENIPSGLSFTSISAKTHAPGNFRIWRRECFDATGYFISISQDSVSEARAVMQGWKVRSFPDLTVRMRMKGGKYTFHYYGVSEYVRWTPFWYVLLKTLKIFLSGRRSDARQFLNGYLDSKNEKLHRLDDPLSKKYYQYRWFYKMIGK